MTDVVTIAAFLKCADRSIFEVFLSNEAQNWYMG